MIVSDAVCGTWTAGVYLPRLARRLSPASVTVTAAFEPISNGATFSEEMLRTRFDTAIETSLVHLT